MLITIAAALSGGAQPELPGFLNSLTSPLEHYGLWAILVLVFVEDFGIPVPGETALIAGAVFAGYGRLNIVAVALVGFVAAVAGDNIGYAIGRFGGRAVVERWGRYVFLTKERLDKAEDFFNRHGGKIIAIARFVEGLRQANGLIAGIIEMRWLKFLAFNALGAALWVTTWVSIGYFAGQHLTSIYNAITAYSLYAAIVAVVVIVGYIGFRIFRKRRHGGQIHGGRRRRRVAADDAAAVIAEPGEIAERPGGIAVSREISVSREIVVSGVTAEPDKMGVSGEIAEPDEIAESSETAETTGPGGPTGPTGPIGPTGPGQVSDRS